MRIRDLKHGEDQRSSWDEHQKAAYSFLDRHQPDGIAKDQHVNSFYQEADALEDEVLFPDVQNSAAVFKSNAVERFVNNMPDWDRFVNDLSTDEEMCTDDEVEYDTDEEENDDDDDDVGEFNEEDNNRLVETMRQFGRLKNGEDEMSSLTSDSSKATIIASMAFSDPAFRLLTKGGDGSYTPLGDLFGAKALE